MSKTSNTQHNAPIDKSCGTSLLHRLTKSVKDLEQYFKCPICGCNLNDTHGNTQQSQYRICGGCVNSHLGDFDSDCTSCRDRIDVCTGFYQDREFEALKDAVFRIIDFIDNETKGVTDGEPAQGNVVTPPGKNKETGPTSQQEGRVSIQVDDAKKADDLMSSVTPYPTGQVQCRAIVTSSSSTTDDHNDKNTSIHDSGQCQKCITISKIRRKRCSSQFPLSNSSSSNKKAKTYHGNEPDFESCISAASGMNALKNSPNLSPMQGRQLYSERSAFQSAPVPGSLPLSTSLDHMNRSAMPNFSAPILGSNGNDVHVSGPNQAPYSALLKESTVKSVTKEKRKGKWTDEEDATITEVVTKSKDQPFTNWTEIADKLPGRARKQIRDRWVNYLNPNIIHTPFSKEEDVKLWNGFLEYGKKWAEIGAKVFMMTRPENAIKNRWNSVAFKKSIMSEFGADVFVKADAVKQNSESPVIMKENIQNVESTMVKSSAIAYI